MTVKACEVLTLTDAKNSINIPVCNVASCSNKLEEASNVLSNNENKDVTDLPSNRLQTTGKTLLQLNATDLIDREDDSVSKISFAVDDHPGTFSSDWDYKDRRQILEETFTLFNNFLVIERVYENDNINGGDNGDNVDESCVSCKSSRTSSKTSSTDTNHTNTLAEEDKKRDSIPEIIVHRSSFAIPATYLVEIKGKLRPTKGMCKWILGGFVGIGMFFLFAFAFLGIEHMED